MAFHLISSDPKYKEKITFITIEYPNEEILNLLRVTALPKVLAVLPNPKDPEK